jgi:nucleotide-binding universal stress UspA family protein
MMITRRCSAYKKAPRNAQPDPWKEPIMTPIQSILAATDFSTGSLAAVERAAQLAQTHGASLRLLHAFDVSAWHSLRGVFDALRLTVEPPPDVRVKQQLTDLAATLAVRTGCDVQARFSIGDPETAINAFAKAHTPSLIVLGSRAEPAQLGLGSTVSKVLRAPVCPVLVVRWTNSQPYDKVLSAVDMRQGSVWAAQTAISLFPASHHYWLHAFSQHLSAWASSSHTDGQTNQILDSVQAQATQDLSQLAQSLSGLGAHPVASAVAVGVPDRSIVAKAAELPADCVVVGHHGDSAAAQNPLGSMAQHMLHHTLRDVLVVP